MKIIDIHTHGIDGYDTRTGSEEHILKIAEMHGTLGVSEILLTIYPSSINIMRENMAVVRKAMEKQRVEISSQQSAGEHTPPSTCTTPGNEGFMVCARILGLHLEGPFLNPSKCGALDAESFIEPNGYTFTSLIDGFEDIVKIITVAPELNGAAELIRKITNTGIIVSMGHSDASYAEAETGFHAGARGITHIFNAMRGFHHRKPGIAGFGLLNQDIYIEVIADPFHLHPKIIELIFKTKNPERILLISDTVKETISSLENQSITDSHGKLTGGCMTITESAKRLVGIGYDESTIMRCVTENPERYLSGE